MSGDESYNKRSRRPRHRQREREEAEYIEFESVLGERLTPDDVEYISNIRTKLSTLDSQDRTEEEQEELEILVNNVYSEILSKLFRFSVNRQGSRCIELLAKHSNYEQFYTLLKEYLPIVTEVIIDRTGSFVFQSLLQRVPILLRDGSNSDSKPLYKLIGKLCRNIEEKQGWLNYMSDPFASFVIRDIMKILAGITSFPIESRKRKFNHASIKYNINEFVNQPKVWKSFRHILRDITEDVIKQSIEESNDNNNSGFLYTESVSLCLQVLIEVLKQNSKTSLLLPKLISNILYINESEDMISKKSSIHILKLMKNSSASRLIETLFSVMKPDLIMKLNNQLICNKDNIENLSQHNIGNFTLQAFITTLIKFIHNISNDNGNIEKVQKGIKVYIKYFIKNLEDFLMKNRAGMIHKLCLLSAASNIKQEKILKKIKKVLKKNLDQLNIREQYQDNLIEQLLNLPSRSIKKVIHNIL